VAATVAVSGVSANRCRQSRAVVCGSGQDVLRAAIDRRGLPETLYLDNGAPFSNAQLSRTCAVLGLNLVYSKPYSTPPGLRLTSRDRVRVLSSIV
jgi:hypothetical protein